MSFNEFIEKLNADSALITKFHGIVSDAGKDNALGNQKLQDDKYRNAISSSLEVVDVLLPNYFIPVGK